MLEQGSDNLVMMPTVAVGYRSGLSHSEHSHLQVRKGDAVFVELGGCWRHYSAPLMFTTVIGNSTEEWKQRLEVSHRGRTNPANSATWYIGVRCCASRYGVHSRY